jgi:hypothetical protein
MLGFVNLYCERLRTAGRQLSGRRVLFRSRESGRSVRQSAEQPGMRGFGPAPRPDSGLPIGGAPYGDDPEDQVYIQEGIAFAQAVANGCIPVNF